jgi:hypothetical protein
LFLRSVDWESNGVQDLMQEVRSSLPVDQRDEHNVKMTILQRYERVWVLHASPELRITPEEVDDRDVGPSVDFDQFPAVPMGNGAVLRITSADGMYEIEMPTGEALFRVRKIPLQGRQVLVSCNACGAAASTMQCGGCNAVVYCGSDCQAQDWAAGHYRACK